MSSSDDSKQHVVDTKSRDLDVIPVLPSRLYLHSFLQLVYIVIFHRLLVYERTLALLGFLGRSLMDISSAHILPTRGKDIIPLRAIEDKLANMEAKVKYISVVLDVVETN